MGIILSLMLRYKPLRRYINQAIDEAVDRAWTEGLRYGVQGAREVDARRAARKEPTLG